MLRNEENESGSYGSCMCVGVVCVYMCVLEFVEVLLTVFSCEYVCVCGPLSVLTLVSVNLYVHTLMYITLYICRVYIHGEYVLSFKFVFLIC